jgi:hypothetical protein
MWVFICGMSYDPNDIEIINGKIEIEIILDVLNGCDND